MGELEEYHQNLMADIRREADASGILMVEAFFDRMTERVTEAGELEVADRAFHENTDRGGPGFSASFSPRQAIALVSCQAAAFRFGSGVSQASAGVSGPSDECGRFSL